MDDVANDAIYSTAGIPTDDEERKDQIYSIASGMGSDSPDRRSVCSVSLSSNRGVKSGSGAAVSCELFSELL